MTHTEMVFNYVACCILDGSFDGQELSVEDAAYNLEFWREDGVEGPDITPEELSAAWNTVLHNDWRLPE